VNSVASGIVTAVEMLFQVAESGKWNCDRCRRERLRVLEKKLRDAKIQIEELKRRNKALEER